MEFQPLTDWVCCSRTFLHLPVFQSLIVLSAEPVTMIPVSGKTMPAQTPRLCPLSCITSRSLSQTLINLSTMNNSCDSQLRKWGPSLLYSCVGEKIIFGPPPSLTKNTIWKIFASACTRKVSIHQFITNQPLFVFIGCLKYFDVF